MFSRIRTTPSTSASSGQIDRLRRALWAADAVLVGAGAGLSTAAGFTYSGERFQRYFWDFAAKYGIRDMYSGGFYPFPAPEEFWAYWSRYILLNRYQDPPKPVYPDLLRLLAGKDHFVLTTNVDHCFQKAGFEKKRLFYTQGDYGLFQCSGPCRQETFGNEAAVRAMVLAQGFTLDAAGELVPPEKPAMAVPAELLPRCPHCGRPLGSPISAATRSLRRTRAGTRPRSDTRASSGPAPGSGSSSWSWAWATTPPASSSTPSGA